MAVGWSEDEADRAYAEALIASGVPVPTDGTHRAYGRRASALDIVLNFFSFILLGIVVSALGTLFFNVIDKFFPDPLLTYGQNMIADGVYYAIAALVVAFPLYYLVVRVWFKHFRDDESRVESRLTKWITYLVLLAASVTLVGDLIMTLFTLFRGEITIRFFLKAFTIFSIAGMVFGFYYLERKKVQYRQDIPRATFQKFGYSLSSIVLVGIVLGFLAAGSPAVERKRSFDALRASDLGTLASCVDAYAQTFERLPVALSDLERSSTYTCPSVTDPETGAPYEYRVVSPVHTTPGGTMEGEVELCATFSLASEKETQSNTYFTMPVSAKWSEHAAGRSCDTETVVVQQARVHSNVPVPVSVPAEGTSVQ